MKTILVLTNFSNRARSAAEFAMNIAIENKANLLLCHVIELTSQVNSGVEFYWSADRLILENECILELKKLTNHLEKLIPADKGAAVFKPAINYITEFGLLADVTEKVIHENSVHLVVIGSHQSNSLTRFIFGSRTYSLIDKINCPVLLIPESLQFKGIQTIAYVTDLTFNDKKVIEYLVEIAKPFHAQIDVNLISLPEDPDLEVEHAKECFEPGEFGQAKVIYHTIEGKDVKESLLEMTELGRVDILALVHKQYGFVERFFHASISKQMADHAKIPLLVMPYLFSKDAADFTNSQLDHFCYEAGDTR